MSGGRRIDQLPAGGHRDCCARRQSNCAAWRNWLVDDVRNGKGIAVRVDVICRGVDHDRGVSRRRDVVAVRDQRGLKAVLAHEEPGIIGRVSDVGHTKLDRIVDANVHVRNERQGHGQAVRGNLIGSRVRCVVQEK